MILIYMHTANVLFFRLYYITFTRQTMVYGLLLILWCIHSLGLQHARPSSFPAQLNKPSLRREKSRASTDPGEARSCVAQAHGEMCLHSGGNYPHAYITVPEEETTTGGSSETSLELHTLTEELESIAGQVGGTSSTESNTPLRNKR